MTETGESYLAESGEFLLIEVRDIYLTRGRGFCLTECNCKKCINTLKEVFHFSCIYIKLKKDMVKVP